MLNICKSRNNKEKIDENKLVDNEIFKKIENPNLLTTNRLSDDLLDIIQNSFFNFSANSSNFY